MKNKLLFVLIFFNFTYFSFTINANALRSLKSGQQSIGFTTATDQSMFPLIFNYQRGFSSTIARAEFAIPYLSVNFDDYRFRLGAETSLYNNGIIDVSLSICPQIIVLNDILRSALSFGVSSMLMIGVINIKYREISWNLDFNLGYERAFKTKITHSDFWKTIHPNTVNGWYSSTGGWLKLGIGISARYSSYRFTGRVGILKTEKFNNTLNAPSEYASIEFNYLF